METRSRAATKRLHNDPTIQVSSVDTEYILKVFPEEVWITILDYINTATDYNRICGATPMFQRILYGKRTKVLFSDVLKTLLHHNARNDWKWKSRNSETENETLYFLEDHFKDLAALRLVSRSWKLGVDLALQNLPHQFLLKDERTASQYRYFRVLENHFANEFGFEEHRVERFLSNFESTHLTSKMNPFITGKIFIGLPSGIDLNFNAVGNQLAEYDHYIKMFRCYGKHIKYLDILTILDKGSDYINLYNNLKEIFKLTPGLKDFKINATLGRSYATPLMKTGKSGVSKVFLNRILRENEQTSCPSMMYLRYANQSAMHMPLFLELVKPNLQHLEVLELGLLTNDDLLAMTNAPLNFAVKKLKFDMPIFKSSTWDQVFGSLETNFGNTLTELHLHLRELPDYRFEGHLTLPHLRILHLAFDKADPLDFLLGVTRTLEQLVVKMIDMTEIKRVKRYEREIKLFCHYKQPHKSNVWRVFPKLDRVTTCSSDAAGTSWSSTREEWKARYNR